MIKRSLVLLTVCIVTCASLTKLWPEVTHSSLVSAAYAQTSTQTVERATLEITRLRAEAPDESGLERLNSSLFWLVRNYDEPELFALLKGSTPEQVVIRAEVQQHMESLSRAKLALALKYGSKERVADEIEGLSEDEIIALANEL